jgi:hypothetical protein
MLAAIVGEMSDGSRDERVLTALSAPAIARDKSVVTLVCGAPQPTVTKSRQLMARIATPALSLGQFGKFIYRFLSCFVKLKKDLRMTNSTILSLLIAEREKLNHAITILSGVKRKGRPPLDPEKRALREAINGNGTAPRRGRPPQHHAVNAAAGWTPERRAAQARRSKKLWKQRKAMAAGA